VFDKQSQTQLEQLAAWVRQATIEPTAAQPATIRSGAPSLSQPARMTPGSASETEQEMNPETKPRASDEKPAPEQGAAGAKSKPPAPGFTPRDPFDAEQFNRLYHSQP
jgi:hypothetical protein